MRMCGYTSADQVCQHAKRMGSICLLPGTPYKERVMELSLDRPLDDFHHRPVDCLLISTGSLSSRLSFYQYTSERRKSCTHSLQDRGNTYTALPGNGD